MSPIWSLRRSPTDTKVSGLCGGIARFTGVDPVLIRVTCAVLALSGGVGLVLYLAGWLLIPLDGKQNAPVHDLLGERSRTWAREVWLFIVAIACLVVFAVLGSLTPFGFGPAVILALLWYFGYYKNRPPAAGGDRQPTAPTTTRPPHQFSGPGPATPATDAWGQPVEEVTRPVLANAPPLDTFLAVPDPVGLYAEAPAGGSSAPTATRSRSGSSARRLRVLCLAALVVVLGGLGAADAAGASISTAMYLSGALLVLGLTMVAAAWFGRARGLLPIALLLLVATIATSLGGPVAHDRGWGQTSIAPTAAAELARSDTQEMGALTVDLSKVRLTTDASYTAHVGMGRLQVRVPPNANVVLHWKVKSGALVMEPQEPQGGSDLGGTVTANGSDPLGPTLTLNLSVDRGLVEVDR